MLIIRRSIAGCSTMLLSLNGVVKSTTDSWRVDETYIKMKKEWLYLYRAVDSQGNTLDFFLSRARNAEAATCFFFKALTASHSSEPRVSGAGQKCCVS